MKLIDLTEIIYFNTPMIVREQVSEIISVVNLMIEGDSIKDSIVYFNSCLSNLIKLNYEYKEHYEQIIRNFNDYNDKNK